MNPYHKPPGHHTPFVTPPPIHTLTTPERFDLMFKGIEQISATSTLLKAVSLLGATYQTKEEFEYLTMPDGRSYQITVHPEEWHFRPLWTDALALIVHKGVDAVDLKDHILWHLVHVRGPLPISTANK